MMCGKQKNGAYVVNKRDKAVGKVEFLFDTSNSTEISSASCYPLAVSPYLNRPLRSLDEAVADLETEGMGDYGDLIAPQASSAKTQAADHTDNGLSLIHI